MAGSSQPQTYGERLMAALADAESPRQQEVARSIYGRLQAGESVDDLHDLIAEMGRVIQAERQPGGPGQAGSPPPGQGPGRQEPRGPESRGPVSRGPEPSGPGQSRQGLAAHRPGGEQGRAPR